MPIEEKPQLLEFNCTLESMPDLMWNIKYDPNNTIALHISGNGQEFHCPVDLFGDVTAFLQSKNILKSQVLARTAPTSGIASGTFADSLLPPKIENQDTPASVGPPIDALSSFDITEDEQSDKSEDVPSSGKVVVNDKVITSETKVEVISRPVIRSRVNKEDPMSAEKEAANIRGAGISKKIIKKKHQVSE